MTAASSMALPECAGPRTRWAPGLASHRLCTPRRSRASSSAWCSRRLGVRSFGRRHCPSVSPGRPTTAKFCQPGVVFGPGVHRPSRARAAGAWWQSAAGPATMRWARRNGRACGPMIAAGQKSIAARGWQMVVAGDLVMRVSSGRSPRKDRQCPQRTYALPPPNDRRLAGTPTTHASGYTRKGVPR